VKSPDTIVYEKIVKWLCHVFILTVYSVNVFLCKRSQILVTLPENALKKALYNICTMHSHLKTTVKLHIPGFSVVTEYKTLNMYVSHFYCICFFSILIYSEYSAKKKYTLIYYR